jgi:uncharacterized membrane protein YbhN (UPF0104 family)/tRNA A-37 threonylcarbamoyl transferase component Bud32
VALQVDDQYAPRVRIPADRLRCIIACVEIALLVGLVLLATETTQGVELVAVGASHFLPRVLRPLVSFVAPVALLVLPVALAGRQLYRRQFRRLAEAVLTGGITVGVVALANFILRQHVADHLYHALTIRPAPGIHPQRTALDGLLAGLSAYITVIGLAGRPRWRAAFWLAIGFYGLVGLADSRTTVLSLLITLALGAAIGYGFRYAAGTTTERPTAAEIASALSSAVAPVQAITRIWDAGSETRQYAVTTTAGTRLDVTVFDRDQQAADAFYRLYRRLRLREQVSRSAPLTVERAVERRALLTYATEDAGVCTPRLRSLIRVGPEAAVLANEHLPGVTLAKLSSDASDAQLREVWATVLALHAHRVTHRALTADRIMFSGDGRAPGGVILLDPGNGDVAATDLQLRLDLAQLVAEMALVVGAERAASLAVSQVGRNEVQRVVPLLQPVVLYRSTRTALRRNREVLPALRKRLLAAVPQGEVAPVQLERFRLRTVFTLVAGLVAAYVLVGEFTRVNPVSILKHADWRWTLAALALSVLTYAGAAWQLSGFVLERLNLVRTFLAQLAGSFVTLVTPAAVGGVALNIRYLRRAGVAPANAAASVGVSQVIAFGLHLVLLVIFAAVTGASQASSLRHPPAWLYIGLGVLVAGALVLVALPAGRKLIRSRLAPTVSQVIPRLLDVAQSPVKLGEGMGGALLLTAAYILCLAASVHALGGSVPLTSIAVVYLTGSAIGSVVPTPGGIGAVEIALSGGLTAAGMAGGTALSSVLLFRLLTFWLPIPAGWAALNFLQRKDAL